MVRRIFRRENASQFNAQLQRIFAQIWYALRSPRLSVAAITLLVFVLLLALVLPQSSSPGPEATAWITSLPPWIQPWGDLLFFLGFAQIVRSLWFWVPVALLLVNGLIALADYGPGSWRRQSNPLPPIEWQHPLARRVEHVARLPQSPDKHLDEVRTRLVENGFFLHQTVEMDDREVGAARRRRAWLGLPAIYLGLVLLVPAIMISHFYLKTDQFAVAPFETSSSHLFKGAFELDAATPQSETGPVLYQVDETTTPSRSLNWRLFQPAFFDNALVLPVASRPLLTVEVRDADDNLLRLIPVQDDLAPSEHLNLPLSEAGDPMYFLIRSVSVSLAVQIVPDLTAPDRYEVSVRRGSEPSPSEIIQVQPGQAFQIDDLSVTLDPSYNLEVLAYRDPAIVLYLLSLLLLIIGMIFTFLKPPVQVWFIPEVKGLGGQLHVVVETVGPVEKTSDLLKSLLNQETDQDGAETDPAEE